MSRKKKEKFVDDGHTVYDMSGVPQPVWKKRKSEKGVGLTGKERRAAIRAAFATYLPIFLGVIACFIAAMIIILLWLN